MSIDFSLNHAENVGYYLLSPVLTGITGVQFSLAFYNNNNNDRLTAFDPGQPG